MRFGKFGGPLHLKTVLALLWCIVKLSQRYFISHSPNLSFGELLWSQVQYDEKRQFSSSMENFCQANFFCFLFYTLSSPFLPIFCLKSVEKTRKKTSPKIISWSHQFFSNLYDKNHKNVPFTKFLSKHISVIFTLCTAYYSFLEFLSFYVSNLTFPMMMELFESCFFVPLSFNFFSTRILEVFWTL